MRMDLLSFLGTVETPMLIKLAAPAKSQLSIHTD